MVGKVGGVFFIGGYKNESISECISHMSSLNRRIVYVHLNGLNEPALLPRQTAITALGMSQNDLRICQRSTQNSLLCRRSKKRDY